MMFIMSGGLVKFIPQCAHPVDAKHRSVSSRVRSGSRISCIGPRHRPPKTVRVAEPERASTPRHVFGLRFESAPLLLYPLRDLIHVLGGGDLEGEALAFDAIPPLRPVVLVEDDADIPG